MKATSLPRKSAQRFHPRVRANFMVELQLAGRTVIAKARDLSMTGLYLLGEIDGIGSRVTLRIPLPEDRPVVAACRVHRRRPDGLAVEFASLDWDDLFALARFLYPRLP